LLMGGSDNVSAWARPKVTDDGCFEINLRFHFSHYSIYSIQSPPPADSDFEQFSIYPADGTASQFTNYYSPSYFLLLGANRFFP
jgi:hypothetical protein